MELALWLGIFCIGFATLAVVSVRVIYCGIALWLCGITLGAIYLHMGAEFLAIVQWLLSTLLCMALVFHAILLGDQDELPSGPQWFVVLPLTTALFVVIGWVAYSSVLGSVPLQWNYYGLMDFGKKLVSDYFLTVVVAGLGALIALIAIGSLERQGD